MKKPRVVRTFIFIVILTGLSLVTVLPKRLNINRSFTLFGKTIFISRQLTRPSIDLTRFNIPFTRSLDFQMGLDIKGGTRVVLEADMQNIETNDRPTALDAVKNVIARRVDLFGLSESAVKTSKIGEQHRIIVELPGLTDTDEALNLIGTTAQLDFREQTPDYDQEATPSSVYAYLDSFKQTGLTGKDLKRSTVQFSPQDGTPVVGLQFNDEGKKKFAEITQRNVGKPVAIFLDEYPITIPNVQEPILNGEAVISGQFTVKDANSLSIQLNAGALPVPIKIVQQETVGPSLGQEAVEKTFRAGLIGIGLVMLFMFLYYGWKGLLANIALTIYAILTVAVYKLLPVTLTLPGIAGLLLSIGMAVDSNILIFERMKEELRAGKPFELAMELGFGRAWDSIKDANVTTLFVAFILFNPFEFEFLNRSGMIRGFALTLTLGICISLFTGIVVTRTLLRLFLADTRPEEKK